LIQATDALAEGINGLSHFSPTMGQLRLSAAQGLPRTAAQRGTSDKRTTVIRTDPQPAYDPKCSSAGLYQKLPFVTCHLETGSVPKRSVSDLLSADEHSEGSFSLRSHHPGRRNPWPDQHEAASPIWKMKPLASCGTLPITRGRSALWSGGDDGDGNNHLLEGRPGPISVQ
jgi:hypothetical protein